MEKTVVHCADDKFTWLTACGVYETGKHGDYYYPDRFRKVSDGMSGKNVVYYYDGAKNLVNDEIFYKIIEDELYREKSKVLEIYACLMCHANNVPPYDGYYKNYESQKTT